MCLEMNQIKQKRVALVLERQRPGKFPWLFPTARPISLEQGGTQAETTASLDRGDKA